VNKIPLWVWQSGRNSSKANQPMSSACRKRSHTPNNC
jgi:hypothetical protein